MKKDTPDQAVSGQLTSVDENRAVSFGNTRKRWIQVLKKWRINQQARAKPQDAESGGIVVDLESP
jgi:hypothetical protein